MVNMEGGIDANEPLDYIEFQIFPSRSRYEAYICLGKNYEVAASGSLEPLLLYSSQIKALHSKGSDGRFKLAAPEDGNGARWFIKSTLLRFLEILSSSEVLKATTALRSEISQLEEAHSFQLSLYGKGSQNHFAREEAASTYYESETNGFPKNGTDAVTSDDSKNELLRAMHLRLTTLRAELSNAFAKAAATKLSKEEINDIEKFCSLFGATDLRKSFCSLVELSEENCAKIYIRSGIICEAEDTTQVSKQSNLPVKYGCSPAKVAEVERQNSSESGESSDSSREEQPSMERSRTLIRSASPSFCIGDSQERFRNIRLQEEYDTHDPKGQVEMVLPFLRKRSKIIEIVAARDVVFALAQSGVCAAFSRETNERICFLNVSPDEVIRSLFYNKNNDSLITVSVYASDNFSSLKCRTTRIEYIRRGKPDAGFPLFESESLKWPGFVEFDDVNGKVLTFSAQDSIYKVFDLKNYTMLYSISDKNVQEIKISPGIMLLIYTKASGHVPLKILSIEDGTVLKSFTHLLHRNKKVDFIELFNEKLLVKQENENLQILDVRNSELTEVSRADFMTPSAFIFLYENQLFLTFRNRTVAVWNFRGELVTSFEDHLLWHPDCNTNNIYITSDQDLIISYCKAESDDPISEGNTGSINISNILTGKCLAKIKASNFPLDDCSRSATCCGQNCNSRRHTKSSVRSTVAEALEDITALFYDEERNEIYTGNRLGLVHVWSN